MRFPSIIAGFVMLLGAGFAVSAWPHSAPGPQTALSGDEILTRAYDRVKTGMPESQLEAVGFDTAKAERLSKLALIERFMPKDSAAFDALSPAMQHCYTGPGTCDAYIFTAMGTEVVLLVEDGRVVRKNLSGISVADNRKVRAFT